MEDRPVVRAAAHGDVAALHGRRALVHVGGEAARGGRDEAGPANTVRGRRAQIGAGRQAAPERGVCALDGADAVEDDAICDAAAARGRSLPKSGDDRDGVD